MDRDITCPHCRQTTTVGIASPDRTGKAEKKGSFTSCRKCRGKIITLTEEDGTVHVFKPSDLGIEAAGGGQ